MEWIDFRQLPPSSGGFSDLFFEYLYAYDRVARFFPGNFRDTASFDGVMQKIIRKQPNRPALVEVLRDQQMRFGTNAAASANIELLLKPGTFAVVTGQQVGLFGGPLYSLLKTLTTVKLAARLKEKFPAFDFVPVFWLEGEDHDFAEMNHTAILDRDNAIVPLQYLPGGVLPERNLGAIGELPFDESLTAVLDQLVASLQKTEFTDPLVASLRECYAPGITFGIAFARWMRRLFGETGLVFLSSNDPRLKKLLSPLFIREFEEFPSVSQAVIDRSAELEEEYHAQVKTKSVNLFMFHKGGRYLIEPREHDFSLKGTRHFLQKDELIGLALETPEVFSANVILRPLAQDILLPTVSYVAGPSEVAYHAQLQPVYERLGVPQPIIYPRASVTFVEERLTRVMDKYGLELTEFWGDTAKVTAKVSEQISDVKLDDVFGNAHSRIVEAMNEMRFGLKEVDATLLGALDTMAGKFEQNLSVLKEKSVAAQKRRNETAVVQIEKAAAGLLPDGLLQERSINALHYLNKYGPLMMEKLTAEMDITGFKHQVIPL